MAKKIFYNMKKTDLAYTAGIIEGEGCIFIARRKNKKTGEFKYWHLAVQVSNTIEWLCNWLKFSFGGSVYCHKPNGKTQSPYFIWVVHSNQAKLFLEAILPYLHFKLPQAEVAIAFQKSKTPGGHYKDFDKLRLIQEAQSIALKGMHHQT